MAWVLLLGGRKAPFCSLERVPVPPSSCGGRVQELRTYSAKGSWIGRFPSSGLGLPFYERSLCF